MQTAKKLGFVLGDFVWTGAFAGIIVGELNTSTPMCEVFGIEQESGSVYASDLRKISPAKFEDLAKAYGHARPFRVYHERSELAMVAAGIPVERCR